MGIVPVEITMGNQGARATGCLIGPRLVLTAYAEPGQLCRVRRSGEKDTWAARRIWPPEGPGRACLLEITDSRWPDDRVDEVWFGGLSGATDPVAVSALGFPSFARRTGESHHPVTGTVPASTLDGSLHQVLVEGASGDAGYWHGMAGAPLLHTTPTGGNLLVGVVESADAGRLTAVPVSAMLADEGFRQVLGERVGRVPYAVPAGLAAMLAPTVPPPSSPAGLLHPRLRTVPFYGRREELRALREWCVGTGFKARLLYGPGGRGKTRLAVELIWRQRAAGWVGGFLADVEATARKLAVDEMAGPIRGVLLVVDQPDTTRDAVRRLVARLRLTTKVPVRLLVLARTAGDWWGSAPLGTREDVSDVELGPLLPDREERTAWYRGIAHDLAMALCRLPGYRGFNWPAWAARLEPRDVECDDVFGDPLAVQQEALAALLLRWFPTPLPPAPPAPPAPAPRSRVARWLGIPPALAPAPAPAPLPPEESPEEVLLRREAYHWGRSDTQPARSDLVAAAIVCGVRSAAEAKVVSAALAPSAPAEAAAAWLVSTYPNGETLKPDRLGEHLVARAAFLDEFLPAVVDALSPRQRQRMFAVLTRVAEDDKEFADQLMTWVGTHERLAVEAAKVVDWVEHPRFLVEALGSVRSAKTIAALYEAIPDYSQALAGLRADLAKTIHARSGEPDLHGLAQEIPLSESLARVGRFDEGVAAAEQAVQSATGLTDRAAALHDLSVRLRDIGDWDGGAARADDAVGIRRQLTDDALAVLALSLHELGVLLARVPDSRDEALRRVVEAVEIRRKLVSSQQSPSAPRRAALASSLRELSVLLAGAGSPGVALRNAQEAADICEALPEGYPADKASALDNLSRRLAEAERQAEALERAKEAVDQYRSLAEARPGEYAVERGRALHHLADLLLAANEVPDGLRAADESVPLLRRQAGLRPNAVEPDLARSLKTRGALLLRTGGRAETVEARVVLDEARSIAERHGMTDLVAELDA